jgi:hypothetical protein
MRELNVQWIHWIYDDDNDDDDVCLNRLHQGCYKTRKYLSKYKLTCVQRKKLGEMVNSEICSRCLDCTYDDDILRIFYFVIFLKYYAKSKVFGEMLEGGIGYMGVTLYT